MLKNRFPLSTLVDDVCFKPLKSTKPFDWFYKTENFKEIIEKDFSLAQKMYMKLRADMTDFTGI